MNTASEDSNVAAAHRDLPVRRAKEIGLQIQALVWSPAPDSRMAVINGAVLHTGGSVADVTVTHIGEDYVVIRKEGELLRVDFVLQ
ncbi:MAG: general secretion pathway protein GspB [Desulfococcaceae bacterium]